MLNIIHKLSFFALNCQINSMFFVETPEYYGVM